MTETEISYDQYVERGMALLDEKLGPDWVDRIDLTTLDLSSPCLCVLGQLFDPGGELIGTLNLDHVYFAEYDHAEGRYVDVDDVERIKEEFDGYEIGCAYLDGGEIQGDEAEILSQTAGFNLPDGAPYLHWPDLTDIWERKILERRAMGA